MQLPIYYVDAFTKKVFGGNPAAVVPLPNWIEDSQLQRIAAENNLSETAFVVESGEDYQLRWFTPTAEIDLCGHATLATAYVIKRFFKPAASRLHFHTKSGELSVSLGSSMLTLDFPSKPASPIPITTTIAKALGAQPTELYLARDLVAVFDSEETIRSLTPSPDLLRELPGLGVTITAPGESSDFVSRAFFPKIGIREDPVTGATHCSLIPYWSNRLRKRELTAKQLSERGGELACTDLGDRVLIAGEAALYLEGRIWL